MPGPPARPLEDRRAKMAKRLAPAVHSALRSGRRFNDLTVEDIIAEAGMARSTFYAHFEDKNHLLRELVPGAVNEVLEVGFAWTNLPGTAGRDELWRATWAIAEVYREHKDLLRAMFDQAPHDDQVSAEVRRLLNSTSAELERHIADGQADGTVAPDLEPRSTVYWLTVMLDRGFYQLHPVTLDRSRELVTALVEIIWRLLYEPVRARSSTGPAPA